MSFYWGYSIQSQRARCDEHFDTLRDSSHNFVLRNTLRPGKFMSLIDYKLDADATTCEQVSTNSEHYGARARRAFDIFAALIGLVLCSIVAPTLLILNPLFNPGALFFRQDRMGRNGRKFSMLKFRSMQPSYGSSAKRKHCDALETDRITKLGQIIRKFRIDELPNFWNVFRGEMSLIGPRPDTWEYAEEYVKSVPHYRNRFSVHPGITGLAQVRGGYADNSRAVHRKARFDNHYVRNRTLMLDLYILWKTIVVVCSGFGAK